MLDTLKPGDVVYTKLNHVSRSGMTRGISLYVIKNNEPCDLSYSAADLMGYKMHKKGGVKIGGCGMDMGFALVYDLSRRLFPDGFGEECVVEYCKYRPKTKDEARNCNGKFHDAMGVTPHEFSGRNNDPSGWDNDGGYALSHRWL